LFVSIATPGRLQAADDVAALKKEIELLKQEIELLKKENALLRKQASGKPDSPVPAGDEAVGIVWEVSALGKDGKVLVTRRFLAAEGKLYNGKKEVGRYTQNGSRVRLDVTDAPDPKFNGVSELIQRERNPPTFRGVAKNLAGQETSVLLRIVKD
jgi:hypothetical protein